MLETYQRHVYERAKKNLPLLNLRTFSLDVSVEIEARQ